jgi:hypothetical protein
MIRQKLPNPVLCLTISANMPSEFPVERHESTKHVAIAP